MRGGFGRPFTVAGPFSCAATVIRTSCSIPRPTHRQSGIGAKLAKPDKQVIVVHGDGSFGINALELDTAVRHNIPILVVISLNGGWSRSCL